MTARKTTSSREGAVAASDGVMMAMYLHSFQCISRNAMVNDCFAFAALLSFASHVRESSFWPLVIYSTANVFRWRLASPELYLIIACSTA